MHVAVEGLDGSGKSTLIDQLRSGMSDTHDVRIFHLPDPLAFGGTDLQLIVSRKVDSPSSDTLALAFAANRLDSYERRIAPYLAKACDHVALSHRYCLSGLAYQHAYGVSMARLLVLNGQVPKPDLTVFLDTDPAVCEERIKARGQHAELFERDFARMRTSFHLSVDALRGQGWNIVVFDGVDPVAHTVSAVLDHLGWKAPVT